MVLWFFKKLEWFYNYIRGLYRATTIVYCKTEVKLEHVKPLELIWFDQTVVGVMAEFLLPYIYWTVSSTATKPQRWVGAPEGCKQRGRVWAFL